MDLGNLLQKYLNVPSGTPASDASSHFDQVAQHASPEVLGQGISDALRSDQTPPLGQLGSFYAQHPQLVKTLGSAALTIALAKMANRMRA